MTDEAAFDEEALEAALSSEGRAYIFPNYSALAEARAKLGEMAKKGGTA